MISTFQAEMSRALLRGTPLETLIHLARCGSTMSEVEDCLMLLGKSRNILVRADLQTAGTGRGSNGWSSPPGGLWFSFSFPCPIPHPLISLYVGWCLQQTLLALLFPLATALRIKWPNDIMYHDSKLAGILCRHSRDRYIIGVGINTNDLEIANKAEFNAISLTQILGFNVSNVFIMNDFMSRFHHHTGLLHTPSILTEQINHYLYAQDAVVTIVQGETTITATVNQVETDGGLKVTLPNGANQSVYFGSLHLSHLK